MAKPTSDPFYLVKDDIQSSVRRSLAGIPAGPTGLRLLRARAPTD